MAADADALTNLVFAEAVSQSTFGGFVVTVLVHTDMASPHLHHAGTAAQQARYMPGIIAGELITAVGITEPGAGSDVAGIRTRRAARATTGCSTAPRCSSPMACTPTSTSSPPRPAPTQGPRLSMFIVEKGTPGFTVGRALDKTGWLCSDTAELVFDDCRIPAGNLLGEEASGFYAVMKNFQTERIALAAMAVGHATQAMRLTLEYVRAAPGLRRDAVGQAGHPPAPGDARRPRPRAARQFLYHCAWLVTQGRDCVREVSMLKALTGELVNEVMYACQQFHGGMGYMRETAIERLSRDARVLAIGGGATEVMLDEVAKRY